MFNAFGGKGPAKLQGMLQQAQQRKRQAAAPAPGGQMFAGGTPGFYAPGGGGRPPMGTGGVPGVPGLSGASRGPAYRGQNGSRIDANYSAAPAPGRLPGYANGGKVINRKPNGKKC